MRLSASAFALLILSPLSAFAQTPPPGAPPVAPPPEAAAPAPVPPPPPPPPPAPVAAPAPAPAPAKTWKDLVTFEGLVDGYYQLNLGASSSLQSTGGSPTVPSVRSFDTNSNTFTLNYAKIALGVAPEPVGLRIDLGYGATGMAINGNSNPTVLQQAYATTAIGALTLDFGKFATTAGAEVIEANKNWNYSRSLLFFYIPLVHTGIRGTFKVSDQLTLQGSIVNGWNGQGFEVDANKSKTFGLMATITPAATTSIILTSYLGKESDTADFRTLIDAVVSQAFGDLATNLNVDFITDKKGGYDNYLGVSLMARKPVNDNLALAIRAEYAQNGAWLDSSGGKLKLYEVTATAAIPVGGRYEFRIEGRADIASDKNFDIAAPVGTMPGVPDKKQQITATGAFLAWF